MKKHLVAALLAFTLFSAGCIYLNDVNFERGPLLQIENQTTLPEQIENATPLKIEKQSGSCSQSNAFQSPTTYSR